MNQWHCEIFRYDFEISHLHLNKAYIYFNVLGFNSVFRGKGGIVSKQILRLISCN